MTNTFDSWLHAIEPQPTPSYHEFAEWVSAKSAELHCIVGTGGARQVELWLAEMRTALAWFDEEKHCDGVNSGQGIIEGCMDAKLGGF